jgi:hypothetical protein
MRSPLDTSGGRPTTGAELNVARQLIERSGITEVLRPMVDADVGRPRHLSLLGFLVACQVNALHRHHQAHVVEVARVLNAFTEAQRFSLGITGWSAAQSYPRVERLFVRICDVLECSDAGIDAQWFVNRLARAAIPDEVLTSSSVAVDGTDVETWGALHGEAFTIELDGEAADTQLSTVKPNRSARGPRRRAKVLGVGSDGRNRYTVDPDARAGHRSATNSRPAGPYVGYELHLAVQARDVRWTNHIDRTTLKPEVPGVVTTCNFVPAGTHRGKAVVDGLIASNVSSTPLRDVVWDPGYSLCQPAFTVFPLNRAGIGQTFQPVTHQRGSRPFSGEALLLDGQLFSPHLPADLRELPAPPRGSSEAEKLHYEAKFNQRAQWRMVRHAGPDGDGVTRWRCPFCAGLLRSRQILKTMRRSRRAPLVELPDGVDSCCAGILSAAPVELALSQRIPYGTTAWRISMGRRQIVESANSALKGAFVDLGRGFFRVLGQVKMTVLLGFTVAGFNLDRIRSFRVKQAERESTHRQRAKRRVGTWGDHIAPPASPPSATASISPD